jgi:hypothetical protein
MANTGHPEVNEYWRIANRDFSIPTVQAVERILPALEEGSLSSTPALDEVLSGFEQVWNDDFDSRLVLEGCG